ncbi:hypothetical protein E2C01_084534 [Portunus trituberculatus]|uniref:Uncharacterized protein n=1 Tax=Portunus trituberculatus TaxID=210409 RepID=A0A5B7IYI9_PORTR|nr:hypothetical protein [Portunus trituberculatus]
MVNLYTIHLSTTTTTTRGAAAPDTHAFLLFLSHGRNLVTCFSLSIAAKVSSTSRKQRCNTPPLHPEGVK